MNTATRFFICVGNPLGAVFICGTFQNSNEPCSAVFCAVRSSSSKACGATEQHHDLANLDSQAKDVAGDAANAVVCQAH